MGVKLLISCSAYLDADFICDIAPTMTMNYAGLLAFDLQGLELDQHLINIEEPDRSYAAFLG